MGTPRTHYLDYLTGMVRDGEKDSIMTYTEWLQEEIHDAADDQTIPLIQKYIENVKYDGENLTYEDWLEGRLEQLWEQHGNPYF